MVLKLRVIKHFTLLQLPVYFDPVSSLPISMFVHREGGIHLYLVQHR